MYLGLQLFIGCILIVMKEIVDKYNDCNEHVVDARRKSEKSLLYPCFDSGLLAEVTLSVIEQFNIS